MIKKSRKSESATGEFLKKCLHWRAYSDVHDRSLIILFFWSFWRTFCSSFTPEQKTRDQPKKNSAIDTIAVDRDRSVAHPCTIALYSGLRFWEKKVLKWIGKRRRFSLWVDNLKFVTWWWANFGIRYCCGYYNCKYYLPIISMIDFYSRAK